MFLFTNASVGTRETGSSAGSARATGTSAGSPVVEAIRDGAQSTGVGFDYLLATAQRESGLDPQAKAGTSSATGLFQFVEQTWLGTMKSAGAKLGLGSFSDAITARSDGSYTVSDPAARKAILDLRRDPRVAAAMAGALTRANGDTLGAALGREPTSGDLYAAHVLGARGAATLIASAQTSPARAAALDLPDAAAANRSLFYDRSGRARGSAELYALLSTSATASTTASTAASGAGGRPATAAGSDVAGVPTAFAALDDGLRNLFQTDRRQGAVSPGVATLWQNRSAGTATRAAPSYFPRGDIAEADASASGTGAGSTTGDAATEAARTPILVPLPPRRPAELSDPDAGKAPTVAPVSAATSATTSVAPAAAKPALLSLFTTFSRNGP